VIILGVESSCDETALALVKDGREVLTSLVLSQIQTHAKFGGVVPEVAAREHITALPALLIELTRTSGVSLKNIDAIAVTQGPGLVGCLLVGTSFAKGLQVSLSKPLIPVNHVHAHIHGAFLGIPSDEEILFPCLALVVSGGHTNLYYMEHATHFELLAHTMDDACGESFDKVAKILGLGYPGGPEVEKFAKAGYAGAVTMPRMLERRSVMAFSYSGLKTAVSLQVKESQAKGSPKPADIAASFQEEALGQLARKMAVAIDRIPDIKSVVIAGGVAANQRFQDLLCKSIDRPVVFPSLKFCSDNAAMIAALAFHQWQETTDKTQLNASQWDVFSRYPFEIYKSKRFESSHN
jgi:N6-L-threonylcarbamoyladenine synthase